MSIQGKPRVEHLAGDPKLSRLAERFDGEQITVTLAAPAQRLKVVWRGVLRDGSSYLRQVVEITAAGGDVAVKRVELETSARAGLIGARTVGAVAGSPVVAGSFFLGYEQPMAQNTVDPMGGCGASFVRNAVLQPGESLTKVASSAWRTRDNCAADFLAYLERERAHPYRPFLHYNSWYDIAWNTRKSTRPNA